jgi:HK97 family phage prohead protease
LINGRIDPRTGAFTPYDQPTRDKTAGRVGVNRGIAEHEAAHVAAIGVQDGLTLVEAWAGDREGSARFSGGGAWEQALVTVVGHMVDGEEGWPPARPSKSGYWFDEQQLAGYAEEIGHDGYVELCDQARRVVADPRFHDIKAVAEELLARGVVLDHGRLEQIRDAVRPAGPAGKSAGTRHKTFQALSTKADGGTGVFTALVAVFGNVDKGGDRIVPGAFTKTLAKWRASRDPIPVIWSHDWKSPDAHIGVADPNDVVENDRGLLVRGRLDIDDNELARRVHKLMRRRSLKEFSFGYSVPPGGERRGKDGANELIEIDLVEVGPTLKGMNPATELHAVKGDPPPDDTDRVEREHREISRAFDSLDRPTFERERDRMLALLEGADKPKSTRRRSLHEQQLRRQCDRIKLEAALGWDLDLIERTVR